MPRSETQGENSEVFRENKAAAAEDKNSTLLKDSRVLSLNDGLFGPHDSNHKIKNKEIFTEAMSSEIKLSANMCALNVLC